MKTKTDPNKPPYCVPSMEEIRKLKWNGLNAVSTFSGCGGSSLGYRMAGFKVLWANEFIPAARDTYAANKAPYTIVDGRDIRQVKGSDILKAIGIKKGELDLFDGSPPCSSFSTAGKREAGWNEVRKYSDTEQRTDDLFLEFIRLIKETQPKSFVAENVSGLVKGTAKGMFLEFLKQMKAAGYVVSCRVLDAQWLGVPQTRQRTIFIGMREDLGIQPTHPTPLPYRYTLRDAIPWITKAVHDTGGHPGFSHGEFTTSPSPTILTKPGHFHVEGEDTSIERFAIGAEYDNIKEGGQSDRYFNLVRASRKEPCPMICASHGNLGMAGVVHPTEKRKFTIAELKRICAFPDDFVLTGSYAQQWERLGRAVPPVMMRAIASCVRDSLLSLSAKPAKKRKG